MTSSSGFDDGVSTLNECGRQVFAGRVAIAERAATHVRLDYRLPSTVSSGDYDLLVQQQPNVPPGRVAVSVSSPGKALAHAEMFNTPGQHAHWQLDSSDTPLLRPASLPEVAPGGCGFELVEAQPVAAPVSLTIASARITAAVVELGVSADGQMEAPPTPDVVGWYRMSARPGNRATVYSVATSTGAAIQRCSGGCGVCTRASRLSSPVPTVSVIRMSSTGTSRSRGRRHQSTASSGHRRTAS